MASMNSPTGKTIARTFICRVNALASHVLSLTLILVTIILAGLSASAQVFTVLHTFENSDGANPQAALIQDKSGNLYATTEYGGVDQAGTAFTVDQNGKFTMLYQFMDYPDGARPVAPLLYRGNESGYGTTYTGGINCLLTYYCGTVFKIDSAGKETVLYRFIGSPDGANPNAGLIKDAAGNVYGTTLFGGLAGCSPPYGCGTVFMLDKSGKESVLYSFKGGSDGYAPYGALIMDSSGNLYGTTSAGGSTACNGGCGTIFELAKSGGTWTEAVLFDFNGTDGAAPYSALISDKAANLYGTTLIGGDEKNCLYLGQSAGCGTVFQLDTTGKEIVLYNFTGKADGSEPQASLVEDSSGNLYGTTSLGGDSGCNDGFGCGIVFRLEAGGKETVLHIFSGGTDGAEPVASLLLNEAERALYGTATIGGDTNCNTQYGGGPGCGTVFRITPQ